MNDAPKGGLPMIMSKPINSPSLFKSCGNSNLHSNESLYNLLLSIVIRSFSSSFSLALSFTRPFFSCSVRSKSEGDSKSMILLFSFLNLERSLSVNSEQNTLFMQSIVSFKCCFVIWLEVVA